MNIKEIDNNTSIEGTNDRIETYHYANSRKPVITLLALNKLKKMRAAKDLENLMRDDFLEIMYGDQTGDGL